MANYRYTINELQKEDSKEYLNDLKLLVAFCNERASACTNPNAPLYQRIKKLRAKLEKAIDAGKTEI